MFATRAGKCVTHRGLAGIRTAPGASLEADGTSLQQPVGPEQAIQPLRVPVLAVNGKDISGMSRMQIRYNNNPEHNIRKPYESRDLSKEAGKGGDSSALCLLPCTEKGVLIFKKSSETWDFKGQNQKNPNTTKPNTHGSSKVQAQKKLPRKQRSLLGCLLLSASMEENVLVGYAEMQFSGSALSHQRQNWETKDPLNCHIGPGN
nr:uncharacterized protein LOC121468203 [Taeniopygia guttata]